MTPDRRKGGVLVIVLLAVALLLSIVLSASTSVRLRWALAMDTLQRAQARDAAISATARALQVLVSDTNAVDTLDEPWANPEATSDVALTDEESRLHLPTADARLLAALLVRAAGLPRTRATLLAESTVAWRTARTEPPTVLEEYRGVPGMDPDALARIAPYSTLQGRGKVNINTLDETLLAILLEGFGTDTETIRGLCTGLRRARRNGTVAPDSSAATLSVLLVGENRIPGPAQAKALTALAQRVDVQSTLFRGSVTASPPDRPTPRHAITFVFDRRTQAFVHWNE